MAYFWPRAPIRASEATYSHDVISEVAVVGLPDPTWIEAVTAFIVLKDGRDIPPVEIIQHCEPRLARFKIPKSVVILPALPKNASGKIVKRRVRENYQAQTCLEVDQAPTAGKQLFIKRAAHAVKPLRFIACAVKPQPLFEIRTHLNEGLVLALRLFVIIGSFVSDNCYLDAALSPS